MVATLVRLRLRVWAHSLGREPWRVVVLVLGALWALSVLPALAGGVLWAADQPAEVVHDVVVVAGTLLVLGWAIFPVLVPAMDDALDVERFRPLRIPAGRLVPGLLVAGLLGVPTAVTAVVCLAPALLWVLAGVPAAAVLALVAAPIALLTLMLAARLATGAVSRALGSRRAREAVAVGGAALALIVLPFALALGRMGLEGALERVPTLADVLAWTPLGAAWAAPAVLAEGDVVGAVLRLVVALAWVVAGVVAWRHQLAVAMVRPVGRGGGGRRRADGVLGRRTSLLVRPLGERPGAAAAGAVARRALRGWTSDPRYVSALVAALLLPLVLALLGATVVDAPAGFALSVAALMGGTIGWGRHNDVAFDGSAFWMHVAARTPGWADRAGRALATLAWAVPAVVLTAVGGAVLGGRPDLWAAALGAGLGVLAAGLAVSAVASGVLVYPVPRPGENPYAAQIGAVGASLVAQLVTSVATFVLSVPVLVCFGAALWWRPGMAWVTLAVGVVGGALALVGGVVVGGRMLDARAPALLRKVA